MGSAASVIDNAPAELNDLIQCVNQLNSQIATDDIRNLKSEKSKLFKAHSVIIELITNRSKTQLQNISSGLNSSEAMTIFGGTYGLFMSFLLSTHAQISAHMIVVATSGLGCDELMLGAVFSVCTAAELFDIASSFISKKNETLLPALERKLKKGSVFIEFITRIIKGDRYEGDIVDNAAAVQQATAVYNCDPKKPNDILDIICYASRTQCVAISLECVKQFNKPLLEILKQRLGAKPASLICYWLLPVPLALAQALHDHKKNGDIVILLLGRCDKLKLRQLDGCCKELFKTCMREEMKQHLSGNFEKIVSGWLDNKAADDSLAEKLDELVADKARNNIGVQELLNDADCYYRVKQYLNDETTALTTYLTQNLHIKVDPNAVSPVKPARPAASSSVPMPTKKVADSGSASFTQASAAQDCDDDGADTKCELVRDYLSCLYEKFDEDGSGSLETNEFWKYVDAIELPQLGYSPEEVAAMREWCDWDNDGSISFDEAVGELTDSVIQGIENQGQSVRTVMRKRIAALSGSGSGSRGGRVSKPVTGRRADEALPPGLLQYLQDSFNAYDVNGNGELDHSEFWYLMQTLNLGLSDCDLDHLQKSCGLDSQGKVQWNDVMPMMDKLMHEMVSDHRDHWLGLVDKASGMLFWYNVRDQASQWMTEAEQAGYMADPSMAAAPALPTRGPSYASSGNKQGGGSSSNITSKSNSYKKNSSSRLRITMQQETDEVDK